MVRANSSSCNPTCVLREMSLPRSLSDIDRPTAANDPRSSTSFSARKNPQRMSVNTLPVFPGLRPRIWSRLLRLATKAMPDRLLGISVYVGVESYCEFTPNGPLAGFQSGWKLRKSQVKYSTESLNSMVVPLPVGRGKGREMWRPRESLRQLIEM